jgi:hypothetical protein
MPLSSKALGLQNMPCYISSFHVGFAHWRFMALNWHRNAFAAASAFQNT